ncbi:replication initiator protein [Sigmofec virus UA08Rod_6727]|uniref:Replication initiator protein n=1 Tax=Sigmofec virus UA08Rod_6727 TaxID=2929238 RepID=A0A976R7U6_9VIRU|nr:replication initiator protein [Sigmofec virus UA08Rod_6727]
MADIELPFEAYEAYFLSRREYSRVADWTDRVICESLNHAESCVVTLTYNDQHLPAHGWLCKRDLQLFFKRVRKVYKIRYFACGEYGSKGQRPHYHVIIFGWCPKDIQYFFYRDGVRYYLSLEMQRFWSIFHRKDKEHYSDWYEPIGNILVCPRLTRKVIPYTCKYMQKFNEIPIDFPRPFLVMSRKPGIGECAINRGAVDLVTDKFYVDGKARRIPRYYLDKLYHAEVEQKDPLVYGYDFREQQLEPIGDQLKAWKQFLRDNTLISQIREKRRRYYSMTYLKPYDYVNKVRRFWSRKTERK